VGIMENSATKLKRNSKKNRGNSKRREKQKAITLQIVIYIDSGACNCHFEGMIIASGEG